MYGQTPKVLKQKAEVIAMEKRGYEILQSNLGIFIKISLLDPK